MPHLNRVALLVRDLLTDVPYIENVNSINYNNT